MIWRGVRSAGEDFIKVKDEEDMPEASNDKKAGLFSVFGRVSNTVSTSVGSTWTSMKAKEGAVGNVTRTTENWFTTVYAKGKEVDGKLGMSTTVKSAAGVVKDKTVQLNEKFHVTDTVKGVASSAGQTVGSLNEKYHVTQTVKGAAHTALDKVSSLDQKLGVSSTLQTGVDRGLSTIFGAAKPGAGGAAAAAGTGGYAAVATTETAAEDGLPTNVVVAEGEGTPSAPNADAAEADESDEKPKTKKEEN